MDKNEQNLSLQDKVKSYFDLLVGCIKKCTDNKRNNRYVCIDRAISDYYYLEFYAEHFGFGNDKNLKRAKSDFKKAFKDDLEDWI